MGASAIDPNTPVIIGVGQFAERLGEPDYAALSPVEIGVAAARKALSDTLSIDRLAVEIDVIASIRQAEISLPHLVAPFGCSNNFPRSIARCIGAHPKRAILEGTGGEGPQQLIHEFAGEISAGRTRMALFVSAEAISTMRDLLRRGEKPDWSEEVEGSVEDRGFGGDITTGALDRHNAVNPIAVYSLLENARRLKLGLDRKAYALQMGNLFAAFTRVAAENPYAMTREALSPQDIATTTDRNRLVTDLFPRRVVARDQVNLGAAVLMTSYATATALGVPRNRLVYPLAGADTRDNLVELRPDLAIGVASQRAASAAIHRAGIDIEAIDIFDLYSCFPIAVSNICDGLGIAADDSRQLTVTGGLPFFGGPGNAYSMHAIAETVNRLRLRRSGIALVGANGGYLSKYSAGIYSAVPAGWRGAVRLQSDSAHTVSLVAASELSGGEIGVLESWVVTLVGSQPTLTAVGRLASAPGRRFVATAARDDHGLVARMQSTEERHVELKLSPGSDGLILASAP
jgi:acetyl-CoA C-acetyltransferase